MTASRRVTLILLLLAFAASAPNRVRAQQGPGSEYVKVDHFEKPVYPSIAVSAHVRGAVVIEVSIDEQGRVVDASVLSGPRLLKDFAVQAVRKWTFFRSAGPKEIVVVAFAQDSRACTKDGFNKDVVELTQPNLALVTACPPVVDR